MSTSTTSAATAAQPFSGQSQFAASLPTVSNPTGGWPPQIANPGSVNPVGAHYTPFITYKASDGSFVVANASQVANSTGVKDFIPQIDYSGMTVTFNLVQGIYDFAFVMYLRMDASNCTISGFEGGICAPDPELAPGGGLRTFDPGDPVGMQNARQTIMPIVNGITGVDQIYQRQGLNSGSLGEGDPYNVMGATPGEDEYSPIWDITPTMWTPAAISSGKRQRLHQDDEVRAFLAAGLLQSYVTPPNAGPFNADIGAYSLGVVSNCPIMLRVLQGIPAHQ